MCSFMINMGHGLHEVCCYVDCFAFNLDRIYSFLFNDHKYR